MPIPTSTQTAEPASIPAEILKEIESFEEEAAKVLNAEVSSDVFRPFRLQHGIYGQRQPGVQMVRIKIPFGGLDAKQVRAIADVAAASLGRNFAQMSGNPVIRNLAAAYEMIARTGLTHERPPFGIDKPALLEPGGKGEGEYDIATGEELGVDEPGSR